MISMQGVPSSLILRNESWVRQQAHALARRLPSNVEKADLIQVGLIAVAQAALGFEWPGDHKTAEAEEAFVRYARQRVKGAMLDELRQMDHLGRAQRRKIKVVQVARERWRARHGSEPTAADISALCHISVDEIFELELAARTAESESLSDHADNGDEAPPHEPATPSDEVEARVDTGLLMRRLETFFAALPQRERQVIDAYLGVGLTPNELAQSMQVSSSRISQIFSSVVERIEAHQRLAHHRSTDADKGVSVEQFEDLIARREAELAQSDTAGAWSRLVEDVFTPGSGPRDPDDDDDPLVVWTGTRWG
jgi:RNA polymerase sigma factor for flagellar operon FliA